MQPLEAANWEPPSHWQRVTVVDAHTGGEPFRVVIDGLPALEGATVLERRRNARELHDGLRKALMWEPRGHADMYGGWVGPPMEPGSHLSVLFMHNEGFSTMCGHGIIALAKVVLETGMIDPSTLGDDENGVELRIDTPAGTIISTSQLAEGVVTDTTFRNVPSFAAALDQQVTVAGLGTVDFDLAFGGAFYALVNADRLGLSLDDTADLIAKGRSIKGAIQDSVTIEHPDHDDLGFLYGVIFVSAARESANHSRNVCVFADGEIDRSPTGTGVSARLAVLSARGEVALGDQISVESCVGSVFTGRIVDEVMLGPIQSVIPEISGSANLIGRAELWLDPDDGLGRGFLLR